MNIWIVWCGVVWSAVAKNILKYHKNINIKGIYTLYPQSSKSIKLYESYPELFKSSFAEILDDSGIDIIVETMWGIDIAKDIIIRSLQRWKSVVSANKDLIASHGTELFQIAKVNNVELKIEASVCGAIPIINAIEYGLAGDKIISIKWILNGTSNYILSKLTDNPELEYKEVLEEAIKLWYAENDPTNDIEWIDSAYKVIILWKIAFWVDISIEKMQVKWISHLTQIHIEQARKMWMKIKLLWVIENKNWKNKAFVRPEFVSIDSSLGRTDGVINAVEIIGENTTNFFSGPGAGGDATAVAIVSDILGLK